MPIKKQYEITYTTVHKVSLICDPKVMESERSITGAVLSTHGSNNYPDGKPDTNGKEVHVKTSTTTYDMRITGKCD